MSMRDLDRPNEFVVDLTAVAQNVTVLRERVGERFIYAALKANAYGYGLVPIATTLARSGVDGFAVVSVNAAIDLRRAGITQPILLYPGVPLTSAVAEAIDAFDLTPSVIDLESARKLSAVAPDTVRCYVKVDVGLERMGFCPESLDQVADELVSLPRLEVVGAYAHMHVPAHGASASYLRWQYERFSAALQTLTQKGVSLACTMLESSAPLSAVEIPEGMTAVDPGRWFYGLVGVSDEVDGRLFPALKALRTRLVQVKEVRQFDDRELSPLGAEVTRVGVVPVGRVDGIDRFTTGQVLVRGRRADLVGGYSIEHSRVDLTAIDDARVGDVVVIIGSQGGDQISPREVASAQQLDAPCLLGLFVGPGFDRVYEQDPELTD